MKVFTQNIIYNYYRYNQFKYELYSKFNNTDLTAV